MRNWFYRGQLKYYQRKCNNCGKEYVGQGKFYCSRRCTRLANPIV